MFLLLLFTISVVYSDAAKILVVVPVPSISHQVVFRPLTQELARRGHEVTVVTTDPVFKKGQAPKNLIEIDVHDISYNVWKQFTSKASNRDPFTQYGLILDLTMKILEIQILTEEFQELIKNKSDYFDILIVESNVRAAVGLSAVFKRPIISMSSFGFMENYDLVGASSHPLLYPSSFATKSYNYSALEKIGHLYQSYNIEMLCEAHDEKDNAMLRRVFGLSTPPLSELRKNVHMMFLNVHSVWDSNRPVPPNVIYVGGILKNPVKPLPQDLESYLNASRNGVIYVSFGTNVVPSNLPPRTLDAMKKVFSELPYDVLWKWDKDEMPGKSENIKIGKWFPQSDLLRHPNIKLFITQGGLQSADEAILAAVPLIGMPLIADQWFNVDKFVHHKIGKKLEVQEVTEDNFREAVTTVIGDNCYRTNIIQLRSIMQDQPLPPLDTAVWWTEYLVRHGGAPHLVAPGAHISWRDYYEVRLIETVLIVSLMLSFVISIVSFKIWRFLSMVRINKLKSN